MVRISGISQPLAGEIRKAETSRKNDAEGRLRTKRKADVYQATGNVTKSDEQESKAETIRPQVEIQPDIRPDRIADVREKIQNGFYSTDEFLDKLATDLLGEFGIHDTAK